MDFWIAAVASSGRWCPFQSLLVTQMSSRGRLAAAMPFPVSSSFSTRWWVSCYLSQRYLVSAYCKSEQHQYACSQSLARTRQHEQPIQWLTSTSPFHIGVVSHLASIRKPSSQAKLWYILYRSRVLLHDLGCGTRRWEKYIEGETENKGGRYDSPERHLHSIYSILSTDCVWLIFFGWWWMFISMLLRVPYEAMKSVPTSSPFPSMTSYRRIVTPVHEHINA